LGTVEYILAVLFWWLWATIKFLVAPTSMVLFAKNDWSFMEVVLIIASGASLGVFIFYNFGERIFLYLDSHRKNEAKKFTKLNRFITRMKVRYGFVGVMLISGLISVPIASLLAARYYRSDTAMPKLILSFWLWTIFLTALSYGAKWIVK